MQSRGCKYIRESERQRISYLFPQCVVLFPKLPLESYKLKSFHGSIVLVGCRSLQLTGLVWGRPCSECDEWDFTHYDHVSCKNPSDFSSAPVAIVRKRVRFILSFMVYLRSIGLPFWLSTWSTDVWWGQGGTNEVKGRYRGFGHTSDSRNTKVQFCVGETCQML